MPMHTDPMSRPSQRPALGSHFFLGIRNPVWKPKFVDLGDVRQMY